MYSILVFVLKILFFFGGIKMVVETQGFEPWEV